MTGYPPLRKRVKTVYCTLDDLLAQVSREKLIQMSNDDENPVTDAQGNPDINTANVNTAIDNAQAEIDSYAAARRPVPLDPVPPMIRKIAVDITLYNLFSRHWTGEDESNIENRYKNAVKWLEKYAKGEVLPDAQVPSEGKVTYVSPDKHFGDAFRQEYD